MPTLEQVCKRLFTDRSWMMKCIVGALLIIVPGVHFFAFGYIYGVIERARLGRPLELPDWDDWRRLFINGIPAFAIFVVMTLVPIGVMLLLTWPLRLLPFGVLIYLPVVPVALLAAPLTAASIYQYQKREDYRDAFRLSVLAAMLRSSKMRFFVPTFALIGFLVAMMPLMTFTFFVGLVAAFAYFASYFRFIEESRKAARTT